VAQLVQEDARQEQYEIQENSQVVVSYQEQAQTLHVPVYPAFQKKERHQGDGQPDEGTPITEHITPLSAYCSAKITKPSSPGGCHCERSEAISAGRQYEIASG